MPGKSVITGFCSVERLATAAGIVCLLSLGFVLGACRAQAETQDTPSSVAQLSLTVSPQPPTVGSAKVDLTITSPNGKPITGAKLQVRGEMSMAGMQPVLANLTDQGNGHYQVSGFPFAMAGDWILTVTGNLPDGTAIKKTFTVSGVKEEAGSSAQGTTTPMSVPVTQPTPTP